MAPRVNGPVTCLDRAQIVSYISVAVGGHSGQLRGFHGPRDTLAAALAALLAAALLRRVSGASLVLGGSALPPYVGRGSSTDLGVWNVKALTVEKCRQKASRSPVMIQPASPTSAATADAGNSAVVPRGH